MNKGTTESIIKAKKLNFYKINYRYLKQAVAF